MASLMPTVAIGGGTVTLTLLNSAAILPGSDTGAFTANQGVVANVLNQAGSTATGDLNTVLNALFNLTPGQLGPILTALAQVASDGKIDLAGVLDATQISEVLYQWHQNQLETGLPEVKGPLLRETLAGAPFSGKVTTPYAPGSVHDYMHAKMTVVDDTVFVGSFNLSHSGEMNAENVVEVDDAALADRVAAYVDAVRARYPAVAL